MKQRYSFGQVFLKNQKYVQKILDSFDLEGKTVLEIGPGMGAITDALISRVKYLYCVEVDRRLCSFLKKRFGHKKNIEIIHADILKFPLSELGKDITIFGNIPYQISSQLVKYLINHREYIRCAYFTFQKEFVRKLTAKPSTGDYTFLSCYSQYYAKIEELFDIPASAFEPIPRVNSAFSKFNFYRKSPYNVKDEDFLFKVIRKAFSGRRKKIINSLSVISKGAASPAGNKHDFFSSLKINPASRAENISLTQYISIADKIQASKGINPR